MGFGVYFTGYPGTAPHTPLCSSILMYPQNCGGSVSSFSSKMQNVPIKGYLSFP